MIKAILIDLDNTLYDYEICHKHAFNCAVNEIKKMFDENDFICAFDKAKEQIHSELKNTASSHNRILYFQKTLEYLNAENIILAKNLYDIYWNNFIKKMSLFEGVIEFLEDNKDKKICVVSDLTAYIQFRKIEKLGISKYLSYIVTSEEAGVEKPNEKIFNIALKKLKLNNSEVCMIGDNYEKDIIGALNLNIKAFWKNDNIPADKRVKTFNQFKELKELLNA